MPLRSTRVRLWLSALLIAMANACSVFAPETVCTLIGCDSGLWVDLDLLPTGQYRIDVFPNGVGSSLVYSFTCTVGVNCEKDVFFSNVVPTNAAIQVTTAAGVRTTNVSDIVYQPLTPNGRRCGIVCGQGHVQVQIPAAASA